MPVVPPVLMILKPRTLSVDTSSMIDFELEELNQSQEWRLVLEAYSAEIRAQKAINPEFDGWVGRFESVNGVENEDLPRIHGKLIALGFVKFQLAGRSSGMQYQLSSQGGQALKFGQNLPHEDHGDAVDLEQAA